MKTSVVIPVFNEEKYITNCLNSLKRQEEKPDEIIIVDNNCTDKTISLAKKYPVRIIEEKKQGAVFARNTGFNTAKYEIIARCDADTILPQNWIKKIKKNFQKKDIAALSGSFIFYDLPFKTKLWADIYFKFMRFIQKGKETLIGPNMALKKTVWQKVAKETCFNEKIIHEDVDLAIHINRLGEKIIFDPELLVFLSGRRIKNNMGSFFIEYPIRLIKTFLVH